MNDDQKAKLFHKRSSASLSDALIAMERLGPPVELDEQKRQWSLFLSEFRKTLKFLELSSRNNNMNPWADNLVKERKDNAVLSYLFHARNADEHGLVRGYDIAPGALNIGGLFSFVGSNQNIKISNCSVISRGPDGREIHQNVNGNFSTQDGRLSAGWIKSEVPVESIGAHISLGSIIDRGVVYSLPAGIMRSEECAKQVAQFACNWLSKKSRELRKRN